MIYYKKPEDEQITECGTLLPTWKSVAVIFSFYTLVWFGMVVANFWFIRHTRRQAASDVSSWVMLTHPAGRLILGDYRIQWRDMNISVLRIIFFLHHLCHLLPP